MKKTVDPQLFGAILASYPGLWPIRFTVPRQPHCRKCGGEKLTLKYDALAYSDSGEAMHVTCDRCDFTWCEKPLAEGEARFTGDRPSRKDV